MRINRVSSCPWIVISELRKILLEACLKFCGGGGGGYVLQHG